LDDNGTVHCPPTGREPVRERPRRRLARDGGTAGRPLSGQSSPGDGLRPP
jgi:hypothetical protein